MKSTSRKTALAWALQHLADEFERRGWERQERPSSRLTMYQQPSEEVENKLIVHEPFGPTGLGLPSPEMLGLACTVNVVFPSIEAAIDRVFGHGEESAGRLSFRLALSQLVGPERLHAGNVHLLSMQDGSAAVSSVEFLGDFDRVMEPVRQQLLDCTVFLDESFVPPTVDWWSWNLRRVAYLSEHADAATWRRCATRLESQAATLEAGEPANAETADGAFSSFSSLRTDAARHGAAQVLRFLRQAAR
ncbi:hypothetical protein LJR084_004399 [Variovorax sp. LjRoot84]